MARHILATFSIHSVIRDGHLKYLPNISVRFVDCISLTFFAEITIYQAHVRVYGQKWIKTWSNSMCFEKTKELYRGLRLSCFPGYYSTVDFRTSQDFIHCNHAMCTKILERFCLCRSGCLRASFEFYVILLSRLGATPGSCTV